MSFALHESDLSMASSERADADDENYDFSVSRDLATHSCDNDSVAVVGDKWVRSDLKEGDCYASLDACLVGRQFSRLHDDGLLWPSELAAGNL